MQLIACGYLRVQDMFMKPTRLRHQPSDTVAVHRTAKLFFRNGKSGLNMRRGFIGTRHKYTDESYRKNRKRFP